MGSLTRKNTDLTSHVPHPRDPTFRLTDLAKERKGDGIEPQRSCKKNKETRRTVHLTTTNQDIYKYSVIIQECMVVDVWGKVDQRWVSGNPFSVEKRIRRGVWTVGTYLLFEAPGRTNPPTSSFRKYTFSEDWGGPLQDNTKVSIEISEKPLFCLLRFQDPKVQRLVVQSGVGGVRVRH